MRALQLLALSTALLIPAAAAHAQVGVYVGGGPGFNAGYAPGYGAAGYWADGPDGRYWVATPVAPLAFGYSTYGYYGHGYGRGDWHYDHRNGWGDRGRGWGREGGGWHGRR